MAFLSPEVSQLADRMCRMSALGKLVTDKVELDRREQEGREAAAAEGSNQPGDQMPQPRDGEDLGAA